MSKFNSHFSPKKNAPIEDPGVSMTKQSFKQEADINTIVGRYLKGQTPTVGSPSSGRQAMFGDYTGLEFHEMQNAIADIDSQFFSLPSKIRNKFKNDAYQLIRWLERPENQAEAEKLGLLQPVFDPDAVLPEHEQIDLVKESKKEAVKADPEAQPSHKKPEIPA